MNYTINFAHGTYYSTYPKTVKSEYSAGSLTSNNLLFNGSLTANGNPIYTYTFAPKANKPKIDY